MGFVTFVSVIACLRGQQFTSMRHFDTLIIHSVVFIDEPTAHRLIWPFCNVLDVDTFVVIATLSAWSMSAARQNLSLGSSYAPHGIMSLKGSFFDCSLSCIYSCITLLQWVHISSSFFSCQTNSWHVILILIWPLKLIMCKYFPYIYLQGTLPWTERCLMRTQVSHLKDAMSYVTAYKTQPMLYKEIGFYCVGMHTCTSFVRTYPLRSRPGGRAVASPLHNVGQGHHYFLPHQPIICWFEKRKPMQHITW